MTAVQQAKGARVLVVEDDERFGRALCRHLRVLQLDPILARTATDARLSAASKSLDAAIVDIKLPDLNGFTLASELRCADPHLPIMILTASRARRDINRAQRMRMTIGCKPADDAMLRTFQDDVRATRRVLDTVASIQGVRPPAVARRGLA